jgi:predicted Zn-dependent protease
MAGLAASWVGPAWAEKTWSEKEETRTGEAAVKAILSETPEWANEEQAARVKRIVDIIAPLTERPEVSYTVHLLDTDDANAFAVPGGTIFVTRGLLAPSDDPRSSYLVVQSDDELAGILAHEIAHNCHYHGLKQADRNDKVLQGGLLASLIAVLLGGGVGGAAQVLGVGLIHVRQGILSHYSIEYETEADRSAVDYLARTDYHPAGLLTFMERIAAESRSRRHIELGIYQSHPYPVERVQAIRRAIREHGLEINRRAVTNWQQAEALDAVVHGETAIVVMLWDRTIYTFRATSAEGETPAVRAEAAVGALNEALAKGMAEFDIATESGPEGPRVTVMGSRLLTVLPGDVDDPGQSPGEVAQETVRELRAALFGDALDRQIRRIGG